jgi:hypothetical protein
MTRNPGTWFGANGVSAWARLAASLSPLAAVAVACSGSPSAPVASKTSTLPAPAPVDAGARREAPEVRAEARPPVPDEKHVCGGPVALRVKVAATAKPFTRVDPPCPESNPFCDTAERPPNPKDLCFVANTNISRAEREARALASAPAPVAALASRAPAPASTEARAPLPAPMPAQTWDRKTTPRYLDKIDAHLHLTDAERKKLDANGFVVLDRLPYQSYAAAFHDVFQEQLPVYVGVDPILHAVARETELVLEKVERARLLPAMKRMLGKLRGTLAASRGRYARETLEDLDTYLGVPWALLQMRDGEARPDASLSVVGQDPVTLRSFVELAADADAGLTEVVLFGRTRVMDASQFTPRGHYVGATYGEAEPLGPYFRATMWLSRTEMNLVSRSSASSSPSLDPAETPREATVALALADLVARSGASAELALFEEIYGAFAGAREDVSLPELSRLAREAGIRPGGADAEASAKLRAVIGDRYERKARTHFAAEGTVRLPVIATLLGPRVVPDVAPLTRVVHDAVPLRYELSGADVAYLLGHDRATHHLASDLRAFPSLGAALGVGRAELAREAATKPDVYGSWLRAILALGQPLPALAPSYMRSDAYQDFRMSSALVGYGQLRHAYALLAAQGYDAYGCEIPDGWVEPLPAFWDALLAHVRNVSRLAPGSTRAKERVIGMLRDIAAAEARGASLSEPQKRWLGMVSENIPKDGYGGGDSGGPPKWTGWYFDLFEDRENGATLGTGFIADYMTLTNVGKVKYVGAEGPRLGVFVVDSGGGPRAMVGPVAKGYEAETPIAEPRLNDETAQDREPKTAPWRASFAEGVAPPPAIGLEGLVTTCDDGDASRPLEVRATLRADVPLGKVSVTLRDHHGDGLGPPATIDVGGAWMTIAFELPQSFRDQGRGVAAWDVKIHDLAVAGAGIGAWRWGSSPSVFGPGELAGMRDRRLPTRPSGLDPLSIGLVPPRPAASASPGPPRSPGARPGWPTPVPVPTPGREGDGF